ncbi:MAG: hypothetical protein CVU89_06870 [Firmicutes bacterium HGW-Firmicutes-14]|nr:MAG: hypothetical protein CVU89_06870 [Firmicutes bacterium HGW-Firmicutes-14]
MLSEKEVIELADRAVSHITLIEKFSAYERQCPDPQVRETLFRHRQVLQQHYQMIMVFLHGAQGMGGGVAAQDINAFSAGQSAYSSQGFQAPPIPQALPSVSGMKQF